ncbi:MAG TPA: prepilin-type N-terminal cleavage/methylation domain-containing protein [Acidimicrobiales bacterium]|jgi:hypothetical protein
MIEWHRNRVNPTPWSGVTGGDRERSEGGFTLIELLIVCVVLPMIIGAVALALVAVFSLQSGVSKRLGDSGDAQAVSAFFVSDVQAAGTITTDSTPNSPGQCGSGIQLLGLVTGSGTEISYDQVQRGTGSSSTYSMFRRVCQGGNLTTPVTSSVVSGDIAANQPSPNMTCAATPATVAAECTGTTPTYSTAWIPTAGITGVTFAITEPASTAVPGSSYAYSLTALPRAGISQSISSTASTLPTCGFATPGTGTYASSICFVDFSPYGQTPTACPGSPGYQQMAATIVNTPYEMTFCLNVSGGPVTAAPIPTYFAPPTSEAFMGNNGFYTGIPGNAALYQTTQGSAPSVVSITNIKVLDSNGNPATGWELVTGDAESTDAGESITWTTGTSGPSLSLLPNIPTSSIGNACATANPAVINLTGVGTTTVSCSATVSSDKTGTVMLEALTPTALTVTMVGTGLQAMFLGLLL